MSDSLPEFLFSFHGRVGRFTYWFGQFVIVGMIAALGFFIKVLERIHDWAAADRSVFFDLIEIWFVVSTLVLILLGIWSLFTIKVKRWHDRDKSGYWILLEFVPVIGPIWALVECGFFAGTEGPNQFGSKPYL